MDFGPLVLGGPCLLILEQLCLRDHRPRVVWRLVQFLGELGQLGRRIVDQLTQLLAALEVNQGIHRKGVLLIGYPYSMVPHRLLL